MEKDFSCNCKGGCKDYRCSCRKNNEPCDEHCGCVDCENPLNTLSLEEIEELTLCTLHNIDTYLSLQKKELNQKLELPCECEQVALKELVSMYECSGCDELYWYSFCWGEVVQDNCTWHCEICKTCRDNSEWHCDNCNQCTYGLTMPCMNCNNSSGFMDFY